MRGFAKTFTEGDAHIGREFPPEFIADAEADFEFVKPRAGRELGYPLYRRISFEAELYNQLLSQQQILAGGDAGRYRAILRDEREGFEVVIVGDQALECRP